MSLVNKLKIVLGLADDVEADDEYTGANPVLSSGTAPAAPSAPAEMPQVSKEMVSKIFTGVVEIFNASLPDFLARSVDPERQSHLIYEKLDQEIKNYLQNLETAVQARGEQMWMHERQRLQADADSLRKRATELEEKRSELNDRKLSAERQKRALSERVRDLETQVRTLEAEKEQLDIENKCMVNKTKASAVLEGELDELRQENNDLRRQIIEAATANGSQEQSKMMLDLQAQVENLTAQNQKMQEALDAAKMKGDMSDAMFGDFQKQAAQATADAKAKQETIDKLLDEAKLKDAQMDDLKKAVAEKDAKIAEDTATIEQIEEIQQQLEQFAVVKGKMDAHIDKLKGSLKAAQADNETLRQTMKEQLTQHNSQVAELQAKVAQLETQLEGASQAASEPQPVELEISNADVDDIITGTDWLVSTPPKGSTMRPPEDNDNFGYQPPQKKTKVVNNDSQMSLFDF